MNVEQTLYQWEENLKSFTPLLFHKGSEISDPASTQVDASDVVIIYLWTTMDIAVELEQMTAFPCKFFI